MRIAALRQLCSRQWSPRPGKAWRSILPLSVMEVRLRCPPPEAREPVTEGLP